MPTKTHTTTNQLATYAASLTAFAERDPQFAAQLYASIAYHLDATKAVSDTPLRTPTWLIPADADAALQRAVWLFSELKVRDKAKTAPARAVLETWKQHQIEPKDIVIGIVGVAVIGPTLGIVKKTKRKKKGMRVILDTALADKPTAFQLEVAQEASVALLATELSAVGGNAYRLEPDTAEWLFSDQETTLYKQHHTELKATLAWLETEHIPHFALYRNDTLCAVAVTPAVGEDVDLGERF